MKLARSPRHFSRFVFRFAWRRMAFDLLELCKQFQAVCEQSLLLPMPTASYCLLPSLLSSSGVPTETVGHAWLTISSLMRSISAAAV